MKTRDRGYKWYQGVTALICVCCILGLMVAPTAAKAAAVDGDNQAIQSAEVSNLDIELQSDGQIEISGCISGLTFVVSGKIYQVYDDINCNKFYFVESDPDYASPVKILNIEFEADAAVHNLNLENQNLAGQEVVRVAAYICEEFYYAEQAYDIDNLIKNNVILISRTSNSQVMQQIISNTAWHTYVEPKTLKNADTSNGIATYATPKLANTLDSIDREIIAIIGSGNFVKEQFIYRWTSAGGYVIDCAEWPSGTGNMLTYCLYYEVIRNTPTANSEDAVVEVNLVADRQFLYVASENTLKPHFLGTDLRMYDVKLALACAQTTPEKGYDYIYQQTTSLMKNDNSLPGLSIAKAMAMQLDKYGVLSVAESIFSAFSSNDIVTGTNTFSWPSDFTFHFNSIAHGKRSGTMVRAIEIDTDGYLLNKEGAYIHLEAKVKDQDNPNPSGSELVTKAIKFGFSYNLRSKNAILGWVNRGDSKGNISNEWSATYTK